MAAATNYYRVGAGNNRNMLLPGSGGWTPDVKVLAVMLGFLQRPQGRLPVMAAAILRGARLAAAPLPSASVVTRTDALYVCLCLISPS